MDIEDKQKAPLDMEPELSIPVDVDRPPEPFAPRLKPGLKGAGAIPPPETAPMHGRALPPGALLDAPPRPPAMAAPSKPPTMGAVRRKLHPVHKYGGKKELVESASHGTLQQVRNVYYIPGRLVDRRHAHCGTSGVGHLYALFFEAHPDGRMRTCVCETGSAGYAEVDYICNHLSTLFEGVSGRTKMPPVQFWVSPPKRETTFSVRRNRDRRVARCRLLLAHIPAQ